MAKTWWLLALAGLTFAGCSSGAPAAGSDNSLGGAESTSTALTSAVAEFTTPSGLSQLRVTYPAVVSDTDRPGLDADVQFLRMGDSIGDTRDPNDPLIDATSIGGVKDKATDTASRLHRTGQIIRGSSDHAISVLQIYPDKVEIYECIDDNLGLYTADGSLIGTQPDMNTRARHSSSTPAESGKYVVLVQ
jgi:hypothetical protein